MTLLTLARRGLLVTALAASTLWSGPAATAAPSWAPAATAVVHPGVMTFTGGAQCTANFVFTDAGGAVYLGQAAHCAGTGAATDTNGCTAGTLPEGTAVDIDGVATGVLAYSSWVRMQAANEPDANACAFNDFALVRVDPAFVGSVNPSVPFWGGPSGVRGSGFGTGAQVYTYGNSSLRLGLTPLSPKVGLTLTDGGGGWTHTLYTATPGIPGDSGSGFLDANGNAFGVLSTVALAPFPASNNVSDLAKAMAYAASHGGPSGLALATGTEPFSPLI